MLYWLLNLDFAGGMSMAGGSGPLLIFPPVEEELDDDLTMLLMSEA